MQKILTPLFLIYFLSACNGFYAQKSDSGKQNKVSGMVSEEDKNGLIITSKLLGEIQSKIKKPILPLKREVWKYDREGNEESYIIDKGVYFDFVDESTAHVVFRTFNNQLTSNGNYLFLTEMDFDDSYNTYYDVVILKCSDQFDLVKLIGTAGINYDVYNEEIVSKLKKWNDGIEFEIVVVDGARIHAYMKNQPADTNRFAEEVYDFCPDVIDQGYGSMEEMITDYQTNKYFWLWWD